MIIKEDLRLFVQILQEFQHYRFKIDRFKDQNEFSSPSSTPSSQKSDGEMTINVCKQRHKDGKTT